MVWTVSATETVAYGVLFYSFAVFLVPMRAELGASTAELSGALTLSMALTGVAAVGAGRWLDRHGPRGLMTAGSLLAAASVVGWSQARDLPQLYLAFAGIGIAGAAVLYEPAYALINTWFRRDRPAALATLTVVAGFASTIFLPTSQALVDALGWRSALLVLAGLVALCALPHALVLRRAPADLGLAPDGGAARPAGAALSAGASPSAGAFPAPGPEPEPERGSGTAAAAPGAAWRRPAVRRLTLAASIEMVAIMAVAVHLVAFLRGNGAGATVAAVATGALGALSVAGRLVLTGLGRRVGMARLTAALVAGQAVGVLLLLVLPRPVGIPAFVLLFGLGFGVMHIARPALLGSYVPTAVFGRVSGAQTLATQAGRVVAPVSAGLLIGAAGYEVTFAAVGACALAAAALVVAAERAHAAERSRAAVPRT
ncbi:MFS transporter [Geodermatophilus sp. YIM 151500]|uniref:MFS transporter n=1 Tax=Geodermatophilus sp. YIM 151500 TaxID=2984531 RepID=UPI0021E3789D|nr:MFS transporter [Geodermatophilus sp. YIM 151500]MCV2488323.1 MFS transporter [Geodermatophilus sp. YIM 151500]